MKLSICIITMNRSRQLKEAIHSCFETNLPIDTEFIIVDNASTDNTSEVVKELFKNNNYKFTYHRCDTNLGVGCGRNLAFSLAKGEYCYFLDDDAIIDGDNKSQFFLLAIEEFDKNDNIVSLTTQIYDEAWGNNRLYPSGHKVDTNLYLCKMFCGGSHFLRSNFWEEAPYLSNKYGFEELMPSLLIWDRGKINVFFDRIEIRHKPLVNKWDYSKRENQKLVIDECAIPFAVKLMMYPKVFKPLLYFAKHLRMIKHCGNIESSKSAINDRIREIMNDYPIREQVSVATVCKLFLLFGFSIF